MKVIEESLREDGTSSLVAYLLDPAISHRVAKRRPCVIVCPGGGYCLHATKEQEPVAARLLGAGYHVVVLRYQVLFVERPVDPGQEPRLNDAAVYPAQVVDLMRTMLWVRGRADEYGIDPDCIYVMGFSAGGHLAGSLAERWDDPALVEELAVVDSSVLRPRGVVMCYPMVDARALLLDARRCYEGACWQLPYFCRAMTGSAHPDPDALNGLDLIAHVRSDMPPVFLWGTTEDELVPPESLCRFAARANELGISIAFHLFDRGRHGLALAEEASAAKPDDVDDDVAFWVPLALRWLERYSR